MTLSVRAISGDFVCIEYHDISELGTYLHSQSAIRGYCIGQIAGILEYALLNRRSSKSTSSDIYVLVLEMSQLTVVDKTTLVFCDSDDEDVEEDEDLEYPDTYYLPILFTLDKHKKERMWKIWVVDNTVHRLQGLITGKKQTYERTFAGKSIGKKNETTPDEQAKQSAETMWTKQLDKGYLPKCKEGNAMLLRVKKANEDTGGHNINAGAAIRGRKSKTVTAKNNCSVESIQTYIKPMKAGVWELADKSNPSSVLPKIVKYFKFELEGVYMQWKLDGWRCAARVQTTQSGKIECVLTTNNGKQYPWFKRIREEVILFLKGKEDLVLDGLDGEVYSHRIIGDDGTGLSDQARFSAISSMCGVARTQPHHLEDQMNLIVFDLIDLSSKHDQDSRFKRLKKLFNRQPSDTSRIKMCDTRIANFIEDVYEYHNEAAQKGYEGVILRTRDLVYTDKRSLKMRKYKNFIDREYPIIDVEKDDGVADEYFVWVCHDPEIIDPSTREPKRFKAKPTGCREDRTDWYNNYLEYIGMQLTVKFQEYSEDGVPRFPIGVCIREDQ